LGTSLRCSPERAPPKNKRACCYKSSYTISLQVPTGKTFINPLSGEEEEEEEPEYEDRWEHKTYQLKKLNQANWALLDEMKGESMLRSET
jgi:hypothetical protein